MGKSLIDELELSQEETDVLVDRLQKDFKDIDDSYIDSVVHAVRFNLDGPDAKKQMSNMSKYYHCQILQSCIAPFQQGLNADSITRAGGMFLGAYLLSKNFRNMVKEYGEQHKIAKSSMRLAKLDKWQEETGRELPPKEKKQRDALITKINGGRFPFSPKSAALTHLGFAKKAYSDMRKPGADVAKIESDYNRAVNSLYKTATGDGCSSESIAKSFRTVVGLYAATDPSINAMFKETCYGGCKPSVRMETKVVMGSDGPETKMFKVFDGDYTRPNGKAVTGTFHLRLPQSIDEHSDIFENRVMDAYVKADGDGSVFADEYEAMCGEYPVWKQAVKDDIPDNELAEFQSNRLDAVRQDIIQRVFDSGTPELDDEATALAEKFISEMADLDRRRREFSDSFSERLEELHPGSTVDEVRNEIANLSRRDELQERYPNPFDDSSPPVDESDFDFTE